jgi:hypothetical protein
MGEVVLEVASSVAVALAVMLLTQEPLEHLSVTTFKFKTI